MNASQEFECPLCGAKGPQMLGDVKIDTRNIHWFKCTPCGRFGISEETLEDRLPNVDLKDRFKVAAYVRWRHIRNMGPPSMFTSREEIPQDLPNAITAQDAMDWFPKTLAERLDRVLLNIHVLSKFPGCKVPVHQYDTPLGLAENTDVLSFTIKQLVADGLLEPWQSYRDELVLTVKAWNRVAELQRAGVLSRQAFVAMWFDPKLDEAYTLGIKTAIEQCGYEPCKINSEQFNDKICDQIIAEIRRSRFLVADCTGHRNGVYFEGGFAKGLGLPVIWTCRKDELEKAHFDTRQYNYIVWETPEELGERLVLRIRATILQG